MSQFPLGAHQTLDDRVHVGGFANVWQPSDASLTRPANTTAYASGNAIGSLNVSVFKFSDFFRRRSGSALLTGLRLIANGTSIATSNMGAIRAHLFNASPAAAVGDQVAFKTLLADDGFKLGTVDFSVWNIGGASSDIIESCGVPALSPLPLVAAAAARDLYLVLVATGAFTPLSAQVIQAYASMVAD